MKKVFLVLCLILFSQAVQAKVIDYAKEGFPPLQPARQNTVKTLEKNSYNKLNYNKVTQAEKTILGQTYENQHIDVRLNRLERSVFNRTYPNMSYEQRMNNIIVNYKNNNVSNDSAVSKKLGKMEKKVFNRQFANDTAENRISRLEEQIFGTIQSGDINTRYDNVRTAILSRPQPTRVKNSLVRTIGNFFGGQITGFTPSFDNDPFFADSFFNQNPYPTNYGTQSATTFSRPFGGGSFVQNHGTGSNCAVQILD